MTDACLLQKAVADYNTEDFLNENTAVKQKKQTRLSEDDASDFIFRVVTTTKEGELATLLGDDIDKTDSLVVNGPIDESDFNTMWSGSFYGKLKIINLENATINGEIIPEYAFYHPIEQMGDGCIYVIWLEKIMLPERVTEIGKMAFYSATCLEEVNFPSTLQKLGKGAFGDCVKLKTSPLVLPEGFKDIEGFVFERCRNLDKVVLPSTIKTIGDFAFSETCITSINFPEGLESLGDHAFTFSYLKEVVIPGSCKLNGGNQFSCNRYLEKIIFLDGVVNIPKEFALACGELAKVVVPQSVKTIEYSAFESCIQLKEIDFPERLVSIGDNAFLQTQLNSITLPSTMNELGIKMFP